LVHWLVDDTVADVDKTIADIMARPGDEPSQLGLALATERAHGEVGRARHIFPLREQLLFLRFPSGAAFWLVTRVGAIESFHFLARLNYFIYQPVGLRLSC